MNGCQKSPAAFFSSIQNMFNCSSSSKVQIILVIKKENQNTTGVLASQIGDNHWPLHKPCFRRDNIDLYGFGSTQEYCFYLASSSTDGNPAEPCDQAKLRDLLQFISCRGTLFR